MNRCHQKTFAPLARWLVMVLALFVFLNAGHAQTNNGGGRWLLAFDGSSTMKKRLPATEAALADLFSTRAEGQLQTGDSVAVWVYDQQTISQFPTFSWEPELSRLTFSNLVTFLRKQRYAGDSSLALVTAPLNRIVAGSERLTMVLFCDGQSEITGTPYDLGINQAFTDSLAERKKNQQPFIVVLRGQYEKFIGCTLNYPPGDVSFPTFAPPRPPPVVVPPPRPVVIATNNIATNNFPTLVIVGKHVSTNANEPMPDDLATNTVTTASTNNSTTNSSSPLTNIIVVATEPAPPAPVVTSVTNVPATNRVVSPPPLKPVLTTTILVTNLVTNCVVNLATNVMAATAPNEPDQPTRILIYAGIAMLALAVVLVVIFLVRANRRPHSSLITSSMQDDPDRK